MAGTLSLKLYATLTNGGYSEIFGSNSNLSVVQDAIGGYAPVVSVGLSEEDLSAGDVSVLGWLFLKNLDATNFITYGPKSAGAMVAMGRLEPGEVAALRLEPGITIRWIADTAAVKVKVLLLED